MSNERHQGCHTDSAGARGLPLSFVDYNNMNIEICAGKAAGYKYFGLEYGGE